MVIHDFRTSFNAGEISPFLDSRVNVEKYGSGCRVLENFIPHVHGPISKRAGAVYVANQITQSAAARLAGFSFANAEYGVAEMGDSFIQFWSENGASTSYASPWTAAQNAAVKFAHVNAIIWGVHPDVPVERITRVSEFTWDVSEVAWTSPPLLDENVSATTLTASAITGSGVTLTASAAYFTSANVGSYFEIAHARATSFSDVLLGDSAVKASGTLTVSGQPADGDTVTIAEIKNGVATSRVYTFRSAGRDAVDEVAIGDDADETTDNLVAAITTGGGGAEPHLSVEIEEVGGIRASQTFGNTTGTNFADNETVTIGEVRYSFDVVGTLQTDPYIVRIGASLEESLNNLMKCINLTPPDADNPEYFWRDSATGEETLAHPDVRATGVAASGGGYKITVQAREPGAGGNAIAVSDACANASWDAANLAGGSRVFQVRAQEPGTGGNSITASESATNVAWSGLSGGALAGGANDSSATSTAVIVLGRYEVRSTGRWNGTVYLEKERTLGSGTWDTLRTWKSVNDYNILETLETVKRTNLRLRFEGAGTEIDGVFPRAVLTPTDAFNRGLVKVTGFTSTTQVTVTVVNDLASTAATAVWSEGAWSPRRGYPRAVCFHQNRLWFAGTSYEPQKLWGSALGDFENFRVTSLDDGALVFQLAATQGQQIFWLAVSHTLMIGTNFGIWVADPVDGQTAFTNTSPPIFRQKSALPCADLAPVQMQEAVVYVVKGLRQVRRVVYDGSGGQFSTALLTVLAEHVTASGIGNMAAQNSPDSILWAVNSDAILIGMSFDIEQNFFAWHRHPASNWTWESVAVVTGASGDEVWVTMRQGISGVRIVARLDPETHNRVPDHFPCHVDAAKYTTGSNFTSITGMTWQVSGPGVVVLSSNPANSTEYLFQGAFAVSGAGAVTITTAADRAWAGSQIESTMVTTKPEYPMRDGSSRGRVFKPISATLQLKDSYGGSVEQYLDAAEDAQIDYPAAQPCNTFTGQRHVKLTARYAEHAQISIGHGRSDPFTLTGLVVHVEIGGVSTKNPPGH